MTTATIRLTSPKQHSGVIQPVGTQLTLPAEIAARYVTDGAAVYVTPADLPSDAGVPALVKTNRLTGEIEIYGPTGRLPLIQIVGMSAVPVSLTGTTAETALASINFPAMGPNDALRVTAQWSFTGSANLKTLVTKLNSATFGLTTTNSASAVIAKQEISLINRNATNVQLGSMYGFGYSSATSGSFLSPSVETNGINTLTLHGQLANSGETITLEGYIVELIRKVGA